MDRLGTNELISGENPFIAILSNLRIYISSFVYPTIRTDNGSGCVKQIGDC